MDTNQVKSMIQNQQAGTDLFSEKTEVKEVTPSTPDPLQNSPNSNKEEIDKKPKPQPAPVKSKAVQDTTKDKDKWVKENLQPFYPNFVNPERMNAIYSMYLSDPTIRSCTFSSIQDCFTKMAILGLNPLLEECYLIPLNRQDGSLYLTFQHSYKGLKNQAFQTGEIKKIITNVVMQGDLFEITFVPPSISHSPNLYSNRTAELLIGAYSVITMADDSISIDYMSKAEIEARRQLNKSVQYNRKSAWDTDYLAMAQVKVLKRHLSTLPKILTYDVTDFAE